MTNKDRLELIVAQTIIHNQHLLSDTLSAPELFMIVAENVREQTLQEVVSKLTKIFNEKDSVELENYIQDLRNQSGVMPKE